MRKVQETAAETGAFQATVAVSIEVITVTTSVVVGQLCSAQRSPYITCVTRGGHEGFAPALGSWLWKPSRQTGTVSLHVDDIRRQADQQAQHEMRHVLL